MPGAPMHFVPQLRMVHPVRLRQGMQRAGVNAAIRECTHARL